VDDRVTTLALAREILAARLNEALPDLHVRPRGVVKSPRQGDGWVTVSQITPEDYTRCRVVLTAIVVLGSDSDLADQLLDTWTVPVFQAALQSMPTAEAILEPVSLQVETGSLAAFTIKISTEVEPS
jgi:hypothetical protein